MKMSFIAVGMMMGMACMCHGFLRSFSDLISVSDTQAPAV